MTDFRIIDLREAMAKRQRDWEQQDRFVRSMVSPIRQERIREHNRRQPEQWQIDEVGDLQMMTRDEAERLAQAFPIKV